MTSILACAGLLVAAPLARAEDPPYVPDQVLVSYEGQPGEHEVSVPEGTTVPETVRKLRRNPRVAYVSPNYVFRAAAFPNDPGSRAPGDWRADQWNFLAPISVPGGIDAPSAWQHLIDAGHPGGRGQKVAVLDTGVAFRKLGRRFRRDPDLPRSKRFVHPRDFVDGDHAPLDLNGHGTHVASTIVQATNNHRGLTGLAYGVKIMPVRILDGHERGTAADLARGIRYAVKHGADVINLSLESPMSVSGCAKIPGICRALRRARNHDVTVVGAAGNGGKGRLTYPGAGPGVIGVGATTYSSCLGRYSNYGTKLDLVAPGGGADKTGSATGNLNCGGGGPRPAVRQFSLKPVAAALHHYRRFGVVGLHGTSMATAHVSAAAALVRAEGVPAASVAGRLECTATKVGAAGYYGAGLLNAGAATAPGAPNSC